VILRSKEAQPAISATQRFAACGLVKEI